MRLRAKKRYSELRKTVLSDANVERLLTECESDIYGSGASLRNHERWPQAAYVADMTQMRDLVMERIVFMDKAMSAFEAVPTAQPVAGNVN